RYSAFAVLLSLISARAPDGSCLPLSRATQEAVIREILSGMSLVRLRDGAIMAAEAKQGFFDLQGVERLHESRYVFSLVPESIASLEDGWYVFRVDLSGLREIENIAIEPTERQAREGDVLYARV